MLECDLIKLPGLAKRDNFLKLLRLTLHQTHTDAEILRLKCDALKIGKG